MGRILADNPTLLVALMMAPLLWSGCHNGDDADPDAPPLQPLIYTEDPELTPEGAAVREHRLQRQLLEGASDGDWGRLGIDDTSDLEPITDPQLLGEAITRALLERDQRLWEHVFVDVDDYIGLVHVDERQAAEFVDNAMGESLQTWELFERVYGSELPDQGLDEQLRFVEFEPGRAHRLDGSYTDDDDEAVQFTDNRIVLHHQPADIEFTLVIPRIFRLEPAEQPPDAGGESTYRYHVGSAIDADPRFETFLDIGLHLDPRLLRVREYPFPLGVGSFWRYRRVRADREIDDDPLDTSFRAQEGMYAEELITEVREVSNYGPIRLVELLHSYDDRRHTRVYEYWAITPRRIYRCNTACRERIEQTDWLLRHFSHQTPVMKFPVELQDRWGDDSNPVVVDEQWHRVKTPAGTFAASFQLHWASPPRANNRYRRDVELTEYFAPDRGLVRRRIDPGPDAREDVPVVEELVEYRIMD